MTCNAERQQILNPRTNEPWLNIIAANVARRAMPDADQWKAQKLGDKRWVLVRKNQDAGDSEAGPDVAAQLDETSSLEPVPLPADEPVLVRNDVRSVRSVRSVRRDDNVRTMTHGATVEAKGPVAGLSAVQQSAPAPIVEPSAQDQDTPSAATAPANAAQDRRRASWSRAQKARRAKAAAEGKALLRLWCTPDEAKQLRAALEALRTTQQTKPAPLEPAPPVPPSSPPATPKPRGQITWRERLAANKQRGNAVDGGRTHHRPRLTGD